MAKLRGPHTSGEAAPAGRACDEGLPQGSNSGHAEPLQRSTGKAWGCLGVGREAETHEKGLQA